MVRCFGFRDQLGGFKLYVTWPLGGKLFQSFVAGDAVRKFDATEALDPIHCTSCDCTVQTAPCSELYHASLCRTRRRWNRKVAPELGHCTRLSFGPCGGWGCLGRNTEKPQTSKQRCHSRNIAGLYIFKLLNRNP